MSKINAELNPDLKVTNDVICLPDHNAKIAELAYLKAESRGFEPGREIEDWLEAESEYLRV